MSASEIVMVVQLVPIAADGPVAKAARCSV